MSALTILIPLSLFAGLTLTLSELRWFRRPRLLARLAPYSPMAGPPRRAGLLSVESFRDVTAPLARSIGERVSRLFGAGDELEERLRRVHSPLDVTTFRVRQLGWTSAAFGMGTLTSVALGLPVPIAILLVLGSPALAFLLIEQSVASASKRWQREVFLELPVIAEQLGMLISAGWSLGAALARTADRGGGACASDLERVIQRIRQGLSEHAALREWSDLAGVDALDRLVAVLSLDRDTADLGRLISEEARAIRRDAHRELIESIERRNQQVWVPVTVAALVPGVLLMGVPFIDALALFAG